MPADLTAEWSMVFLNVEDAMVFRGRCDGGGLD